MNGVPVGKDFENLDRYLCAAAGGPGANRCLHRVGLGSVGEWHGDEVGLFVFLKGCLKFVHMLDIACVHGLGWKDSLFLKRVGAPPCSYLLQEMPPLSCSRLQAQCVCRPHRQHPFWLKGCPFCRSSACNIQMQAGVGD